MVAAAPSGTETAIVAGAEGGEQARGRTTARVSVARTAVGEDALGAATEERLFDLLVVKESQLQ